MYSVGDIIHDSITGQDHIILYIDETDAIFTYKTSYFSNEMSERYTVIGKVSEDTLSEITPIINPM